MLRAILKGKTLLRRAITKKERVLEQEYLADGPLGRKIHSAPEGEEIGTNRGRKCTRRQKE